MSDPVYLVSRCSSMEEFVAAFRRYADRLGVFVPAAAPVAVGRKTRFAITLKDGGIVIDGDAEVIMSSSRASGLHGRPGMTLRFSRVDDDSRAVLDHLEKVRFGAKVTVGSSHLKVRPGPAHAEADAATTPTKPGLDPAQALAECIVIGDDGAAGQPSGRTPLPGATPVPMPVKSGRFSVPPVSGPIATAAPPAPPNVPATPPTRRDTPPPLPVSVSSRQTMMGPAVSDPRTPAPVRPTGSGPTDGVPTPAVPQVTLPGGAATVPTMTAMPGVPTVEPGWLRHTTKGVAPPGTSEEFDIQVPVAAKPPLVPAPPVLPPPAAKLTTSKNKTMMGLQAIAKEPALGSSPGIAVPPAIEAEPPTLPAQKPPPSPQYSMGRAATEQPTSAAAAPPTSIEIDPALMEHTDAQPIVDPAAAGALAASGVPAALPTQPAPPGWPAPTQPARGDLTDAGTGFFQNDSGTQPVAPSRGVGYLTDANTGFFTETGAQPAIGYQSEDMTALVTTSPRQKRMLVIVVSCTAVLALAFVAIAVVGGGGKSKSKNSDKPTPTTAVAEGGTTAVAPAVKPDDGSADPAAGDGSAVAAADPAGDGSAAKADDPPGGDGSAVAAADPAGDGSAAKPDDPPGGGVAAIAPPATGDCSVKVTSSPVGAEVFIGGTSRGKTPVTVALPCTSTRVTVRHSRYNSWSKKVRPSARGTKVSARLQRPTFTVKISSVPSGATISIGGKKAGKTPSQVKVPGYDATTITLFKDGYVTATERVTAKQNGTAIKMTLRRR